MSFKPRAELPATALTLPSRYYTDPTIFARELDVFYRQMWVAVGRVEEMPAAGHYLERRVGGESVIVVRTDAAGRIRAFFNVCRHRGTQICSEAAGAFSGAIRCPYHAWTYDYEGRLITAPHMEGSPAFQREAFPLISVRADAWDGYVFVSLSETGPSLRDHLAELPSLFEPWQQGRLACGHRVTYDVAANWKLIVQNYNECLHCPTLHPALNRLSHYLSGVNQPLRPTYMGGRMDLNAGVTTFSADGASPRTALPGISAEDRTRVYFYSIFPNLMIAPHPDYVLTHTLWPEAPNRTRIVCEWLVDPVEMARPEFTLADAVTFWDMTNRQDWHICELAQRGIGSWAYRPGPYSSREDLLHAFDRYVLEKLGE
jgi:Rieske 2Fe-2S family protein